MREGEGNIRVSGKRREAQTQACRQRLYKNVPVSVIFQHLTVWIVMVATPGGESYVVHDYMKCTITVSTLGVSVIVDGAVSVVRFRQNR